jgi:hypothetical protein
VEVFALNRTAIGFLIAVLVFLKNILIDFGANFFKPISYELATLMKIQRGILFLSVYFSKPSLTLCIFLPSVTNPTPNQSCGNATDEWGQPHPPPVSRICDANIKHDSQQLSSRENSTMFRLTMSFPGCSTKTHTSSPSFPYAHRLQIRNTQSQFGNSAEMGTKQTTRKIIVTSTIIKSWEI